MSYAACLPTPPSALRWPNRGVSVESNCVETLYAAAMRHLASSFGKQVEMGELEEKFRKLMLDHSAPDWDGYDARPASPDAVERAYAFAGSLPPGLASPDVSINPYGDVEFEWYVRPSRVLTLSIGDGGRYHFASLNGMERDSGAGYIVGLLPERVLLAIARVVAC